MSGNFFTVFCVFRNNRYFCSPVACTPKLRQPIAVHDLTWIHHFPCIVIILYAIADIFHYFFFFIFHGIIICPNSCICQIQSVSYMRIDSFPIFSCQIARFYDTELSVYCDVDPFHSHFVLTDQIMDRNICLTFFRIFCCHMNIVLFICFHINQTGIPCRCSVVIILQFYCIIFDLLTAMAVFILVIPVSVK